MTPSHSEDPELPHLRDLSGWEGALSMEVWECCTGFGNIFAIQKGLAVSFLGINTDIGVCLCMC